MSLWLRPNKSSDRPKQEMSNRPNWDETFMRVAQEYAGRSACLRRKVGAVIVRDRHQLTSGYNGPPRGLPHCAELGGCEREKRGLKTGEGLWICRAVHAEANAIIQAAKCGPSIDGGTIYTTLFPCNECAKMIINAGLVEIVAFEDYSNEEAKTYLESAGILVRFIE